jgi:glutaredoxin
VDIYYASWDTYSNKAIMFFRENHVVVNAYDIDLDPEAAARKKRIDPNFVGMPLVIINGDVIRGVDEKRYRDALAKPPQ